MYESLIYLFLLVVIVIAFYYVNKNSKSTHDVATPSHPSCTPDNITRLSCEGSKKYAPHFPSDMTIDQCVKQAKSETHPSKISEYWTTMARGLCIANATSKEDYSKCHSF